MKNTNMKVKYVDLNGLKYFAEELKRWLKNSDLVTNIDTKIEELNKTLEFNEFNSDFNNDFTINL